MTLHISTRKKIITTDLGQFRSRSLAPLKMLALLWLRAREHPGDDWVTAGEIAHVAGLASHPRQLLRWVDYLEQANVSWLGYETRSRGRYRLACPPDQLQFDLGDDSLRDWLGLSNALAPIKAPREPVDAASLLLGLGVLLTADSLKFDGNLSQAMQGMGSIPAESLPADPEWQYALLLRRANIASRRGQNNLLAVQLARLKEIQRNDCNTPPWVAGRSAIFAAKAHYDKRRFHEASRALDQAQSMLGGDVWTEGRYHNMRGLNLFGQWRQRYRKEGPGDAESNLATQTSIFNHYSQALACQVNVHDYQGISATLFNMANTYLWPINAGIINNNSQLELGLGCIGLTRFVCTHFFVGKDSVWGQILALETALASGRDFSWINQKTSHVFANITRIENAAKLVLENATQIGNPGEIDAAQAIVDQINQQISAMQALNNPAADAPDTTPPDNEAPH